MYEAIMYFCTAYIAVSVVHYLSLRHTGYSKDYSLDFVCKEYYGQ